MTVGWNPVWDAVAAAGVPVTIHVADPVAFFEPMDARNERVEELLANPDWWFGDRDRFPSFAAIIEALEALVARRQRRDVHRCARAVLRGGHRLGRKDARHVSERVRRRGRADRGARTRCRARRASCIVRHPDRFLFGTDAFPPDGDVYEVHRRFFETADEHFPYDADPGEVPSQGRWTISGLDLPPDVLERMYAANAKRLLGI